VRRAFGIVVALVLVSGLGLAPAAPVGAVQPPITVEVTNPIAWDLSDYIIEFRNAALLLGPADYIDIMFPADADPGTVTSVTVTAPATVTTYVVIGTSLRIRLADGEAIEGGADVAIVVADVTNPGPCTHILCVGTSTASQVCSDEGEPEVVATHELTMTADAADRGMAIDVTGESPYRAGKVVGIRAEANAGYRFVNWTAAPEVVFDDAGAAETTFVMPDEAVTVTARFESVSTYTVTLAADPLTGGVATDEAGTGVHEAGATVPIEAVAASGYRFVDWTAAPEVEFGNADAVETNFVMPDEAVTVTANFVAVRELTISSTGGGRVTAPGEGKFIYDAGERVGLAAVADDGYEFAGWTGDAAAVADPDSVSTTIVVDRDHSVTASFVETPPAATGCFIATAVYGTSGAERIDVLREFRDVVLMESEAGFRFVTWYYRASPPIAEFLAGSELLRTFTGEFLVNPVVWMVEATATMWQAS